MATICDLDHTARMVSLPGHIFTFREIDYQYGVGDLRLRVERIDVAEPTIYDGEVWYPVEGVQVYADGTELGRRLVLVRGRRLPGLAGRQG